MCVCELLQYYVLLVIYYEDIDNFYYNIRIRFYTYTYFAEFKLRLYNLSQ